MKIKNIAAICKKNKYAVIYERYGESGGVIQYIGDGAAAYPVTGLPKLDIEGITENKPVYLDFEQVAAIVRLYSDEKEAGGGE